MAYLIQYSGTGTEGKLREGDEPIYWTNGRVEVVQDECVKFYLDNATVFTVLKNNAAMAAMVSEGTGGASYVVDVMETAEGIAAVKAAADETYVDGFINANWPGAKAAAYVDFNTVAEAGMKVTIAGVDYQEADTADDTAGVWTNGASAADSATSFIAAINGNTSATVPFTAAADLSGDGAWLYADAVGVSGNISIHTDTPTKLSDVPAAMIKFTGAGEAAMQVTVGGVVYLEADTADAANGVWTNGASAENSVDSLLAALNGDTRATVPFTAYKVGTDSIFLSWDDTEETDAFVITETSATNCTVHQARYLAFSGVGAPGTSVVIGGFIFDEADSADAPNGIWTNGASAADSATSLIAAINGDTTPGIEFTAVADAGGDGLWLSQDTAGVASSSITYSAESSSCTVGNFTRGKNAGAENAVNITHTVTANELLSGHIDFPIPFIPETWSVSAFTATGALVYFTDLVTWEASPVNMLRITTDGATNIAATDKVHIVAVG